VGLTIAHQNLDQLDTKLRSVMMTNTSLKIVGGLSSRDADVFAKEMQCEPELILQHATKTRDGATFAAFAKSSAARGPGGMTIPFGLMDRQPKLTQKEYDAIIDANRMRFSMPRRKKEGQFERVQELTEPDLI
jgi:hypothetical protein